MDIIDPAPPGCPQMETGDDKDAEIERLRTTSYRQATAFADAEAEVRRLREVLAREKDIIEMYGTDESREFFKQE